MKPHAAQIIYHGICISIDMHLEKPSNLKIQQEPKTYKIITYQYGST